MKLLTLARHAKSSWSDADVSDFDRTLNPRGRRDAPEMARRLLSRQCVPELVISSPARRTRETTALFADGLRLETDCIAFEDSFYEASAGDLLQAVGLLDNSVNHAMLVGHNPSIQTLTGMLGDGALHTPSCAVSHYQIDCERWNDLTASSVSLLFHDFPKNTD